MVVIPNTLELNTLWVTQRRWKPRSTAHPHIGFGRPTSVPIPLRRLDGTLDQESMFPESVRGRRAVGAAYSGH